MRAGGESFAKIRSADGSPAEKLPGSFPGRRSPHGCHADRANGADFTMNIIQKVFGTHSQRELKRIEPIVNKIESLRPAMMELSDEALRDRTKIGWKNARNAASITTTANATTAAMKTARIGNEKLQSS